MAYQPAGSDADCGSGCGRECGATTNTCKPGAKAKQQSASEKRASVKTQQSAALHSGAKRECHCCSNKRYINTPVALIFNFKQEVCKQIYKY